jgi:hypothetical protein
MGGRGTDVARPLLVVPYIQQDTVAGRHALLAWNGSVEAIRALDAALPFLHAAEKVTVAVFGAPGEAAVRSCRP